MKLPRRRFLQLAAGAAGLPAVSRTGWALTYPTRPVHLIVPFGPGGASDIVARLMGQWLSDRLGQPFVIDNRPGAGGHIGTEAVVKAPADGYTLLQASVATVIAATLYDNLSFIRDLAPIASIMRTPAVMEVSPSFAAKTVPELIAYAKANPGRINMATVGGSGSVGQVYGELFKMMAGVDLVPVPYRTESQAFTDLIGGRVQVIFDPVPSSIEQIKAGRLRLMAVTTSTRLPLFPDIPTVAEFVPGYEANGWQGICAPRNTPPELLDKLNGEINAALAEPTMKARLADLGGAVLFGSPAEFGKLIASDTEKWTKVVKFAGIKPD